MSDSAARLQYGAHLPLIGFAGERWSLAGLCDYVRAARELGFKYLTANDHLVFPAPWLDGLVALAATLRDAEGMTLMTTVSLPVVRGPAALAKAACAIDLLSEGRLILGVGPGSSPYDYEVAGLRFEDRWKRFDDAVAALRTFWREGERHIGPFYSGSGDLLRPLPARPGGPPIWIGAWGSEAGIRRVARAGDGWLASAYNTSPGAFAAGISRLRIQLSQLGRDPERFPNAVATMLVHVTDDAAEARRVLEDVVAPVLKRPAEELGERLLIGGARESAAKLADLAEAGVQRVFIWPVLDPTRQLELFMDRVALQAGST